MMKMDLEHNEIKELEMVLSNFKRDWEQQQIDRAAKWRLHFLLSAAVVLFISVNVPSFWWLNIAVVAYFAGSLFTMIRKRIKTNQQITEHQKQLELVRLLRKFEASPYSKKD